MSTTGWTAETRCRLMESCVLKLPFGEGALLCSFVDAASALRLFSYYNGEIYEIIRDASGEWSFAAASGDGYSDPVALAGGADGSTAVLFAVWPDRVYYRVLAEAGDGGFHRLDRPAGPAAQNLAAAVGLSPDGNLLLAVASRGEGEAGIGWLLYDWTATWEGAPDDERPVVAASGRFAGSALHGLGLGVAGGEVLVVAATDAGLAVGAAAGGAGVPIVLAASASALAVVSDWSETTDLFAQTPEGVVHWQGAGSAWRAAPVPVLPAEPYAQLFAARDEEGALELFALGASIHYLRQGGERDEEEWFAFPDVELAASFLTGARNAAGLLDAFAVESDGGGATLFSLRQTPDDWQVDAATYASVQTLHIVQSYAAELTLLGAERTPEPNRPLGLAASERALLVVNGETLRLAEPGVPVPVTTNAAGRLNIVCPVYRLGCPDLLVTAGEAAYPIAPYREVRRTLAGATAAALAAGLPSLAGRSCLPDLAAALHALLALPVEGAAAPRLRIDRGPDGPRCRELAPGEPALDGPGPLDRGWREIWDDLGGDDGAEVETILLDAGTVTLSLASGARRRVYRARLATVQQALDLAGELFAWVSVSFPDLFDWLGCPLDLEDAYDTQQALAWSLRQLLDFLAGSVPGFTLDAAATAELRQGMRTAFFRCEAPAVRSLQETCGTASRPAGETLPLEVAFNALFDNLPWLDLPEVEAAADEPTALGELYAEWRAWAATFGSSSELAALGDYVSGSAGGAGGFLDHPMTDLFAAAEPACLAVLDPAAAFAGRLFAALPEIVAAVDRWLEAPAYVPVLSELYELAAGKPVETTLLDLLTFVPAFGATAAYKLAYDGSPPFSDRLLREHREGCDRGALAAAFRGHGEGAAEPAEWRVVGAEVRRLAGGFTNLLMAPLVAMADAAAAVGGAAAPPALGPLLLVGEWLQALAGCPWPWVSEPPGTEGADGIAGLRFLLGPLAGAAVDALALEMAGRPAWLLEDVGCGYSLARGALGLGMSVRLAVLEAEEDRVAAALDICSALPDIFRWLGSAKVVAATDGGSREVLASLDRAIGGLTGAAPIAAALGPPAPGEPAA